MNDSPPHPRDCAFCATGRAVLEFADAEYETLARRAVWHMRRTAAIGAFEDGFHYRTLWDEYCRYVQDRPDGISAYAWRATVSAVTEWLVETIPAHVAPLMTLALACGAADDEHLEGKTNILIDRAVMEQHLADRVEDLARRHDLLRLKRRRDDP